MDMETFEERPVLPGDRLTDLVESNNKKIILGPGLKQNEEQVCQVCKPGILKFKHPNVYWVDSHQKRYVPVKGDLVIGVITTKAGDIFRVDVGGSEQVTLSYLSFEGSTKRNRPDVKVGDIVYGKFLAANKDTEPELVCIDSLGRSSGMGVIRSGGFVFQCSLNLARKILTEDNVLFKNLGKNIPFETAVGLNGRIWIKAKTNKQTIAVANAICSSEYMSNAQIKSMCRKLFDVLAGF